MKLETSVLAACCSSLEGREGAGWMKEQRKCIAEQILERAESSLKPLAFIWLVLHPVREEQGKKRYNGPTAQAVLERPFADMLICPWKFPMACCEGNFIAEALNTILASAESGTELPAELTGTFLSFICSCFGDIQIRPLSCDNSCFCECCVVCSCWLGRAGFTSVEMSYW